MTSNDRTQEQILARLAAMETYLAQIAAAVTAIAKRQYADYDFHVRLTPAARPEPAAGANVISAAAPESWQPPSSGLTDIFRSPAGTGAVPGGALDATSILNARSLQPAQPEPPAKEPSEFTREFEAIFNPGKTT